MNANEWNTGALDLGSLSSLFVVHASKQCSKCAQCRVHCFTVRHRLSELITHSLQLRTFRRGEESKYRAEPANLWQCTEQLRDPQWSISRINEGA